jgi:decaprenylphospho-beta-D-ribofuranose 2-oxidase
VSEQDTESTSRQASWRCKASSLVGWGRYPRIEGRVCLPGSTAELSTCLEEAAGEGLLGRGLGRSYGDAALSSRACILATGKLNRLLSFDDKTGTLICEPGLSYADMIKTLLPRGWFAAVTPGTKHVSMGGALAADIHGKNHHKDGSFVDFVSSFKLITADGQQLSCSRQENSDLFWATAGGMGLTGFIAEVAMTLRPVENPFVVVKKVRCANLAETFRMIEESETSYPYSVSWIDCLSAGKNLGRSILILGRHALNSELSPQHLKAGATGEKRVLQVPLDMPSWILNRYSIAAFNAVYYHLSQGDGRERISNVDPFFYPLDMLSDWNRLYGKDGFIQYQCVLPLSTCRAGLEELLTLSSKRGRSSFLAVLKKFGAGHGLLSFPEPGYTLALDMPVKTGLVEFTQELDALVIKYGGRIYLAKDACLSPESFRKMYGELDKWLSLKRAVDPNNRFSSALSERLRLF